MPMEQQENIENNRDKLESSWLQSQGERTLKLEFNEQTGKASCASIVTVKAVKD